MMYLSEFHWKSEFSIDRRRELVDWVNSLATEQQEMVEDLRQDARDEEADDPE